MVSPGALRFFEHIMPQRKKWKERVGGTQMRVTGDPEAIMDSSMAGIFDGN
jgi:hypothetical protein